MVEMDSGRVQFSQRNGPALPKEDTIERIRRQAREAWEADGCPEGCEDDYLERAKRDVMGPDSAPS